MRQLTVKIDLFQMGVENVIDFAKVAKNDRDDGRRVSAKASAAHPFADKIALLVYVKQLLGAEEGRENARRSTEIRRSPLPRRNPYAAVDRKKTSTGRAISEVRARVASSAPLRTLGSPKKTTALLLNPSRSSIEPNPNSTVLRCQTVAQQIGTSERKNAFRGSLHYRSVRVNRSFLSVLSLSRKT